MEFVQLLDGLHGPTDTQKPLILPQRPGIDPAVLKTGTVADIVLSSGQLPATRGAPPGILARVAPYKVPITVGLLALGGFLFWRSRSASAASARLAGIAAGLGRPPKRSGKSRRKSSKGRGSRRAKR